MKFNKKDGGIVYSTDRGKMCPLCAEQEDQCRCRRKTVPSHGDGMVMVSRETKGRKGSGVTLISDVPINHDGLKQLAKNLKKKCGAGGSVKNGIIEIQGDHRELVIAELEKDGYKIKLAGG